jgi:hypothetical protein
MKTKPASKTCCKCTKNNPYWQAIVLGWAAKALWRTWRWKLSIESFDAWWNEGFWSKQE